MRGNIDCHTHPSAKNIKSNVHIKRDGEVVKRKSFRRYLYELISGKILNDDENVYMSCGNECCINFEHMAVCSDTELPYIALSKRGDVSGERNGNAKLTKDKVKKLRKRLAEGCLYGDKKQLAYEYGICMGTLIAIEKRRLWKNI